MKEAEETEGTELDLRIEEPHREEIEMLFHR
jgi:hypothetical protein